MYREFSFYLGRTMSEQPQHFIFTIIYGVLTYWLYGFQNDAEKFLMYEAILCMTIYAGFHSFFLFCFFFVFVFFAVFYTLKCKTIGKSERKSV